jgi:hypothetical protein
LGRIITGTWFCCFVIIADRARATFHQDELVMYNKKWISFAINLRMKRKVTWMNGLNRAKKENKEISQDILDKKIILEAYKAKIHDLNKIRRKHVKVLP